MEINIIAEALSGLKKYQWEQLKVVVDKLFQSKSARLELDAPQELEESIRNLL